MDVIANLRKVHMPKALRVIHFDDDIFEIERVSKALANDTIETKFDLLSVMSAGEFSQKLLDTSPDVVLLDIHDHDHASSGTMLIEQVRNCLPNCVIIMRSNLDDSKTIRTCLTLGADDFISKATDKGELCLRVLNSYQLCLWKRGLPLTTGLQVNSLTQVTAVGGTLNRISQRIPRILASAVSSVFISGESGTGKEVVASLFRSGLGKSSPFLAFNCGAIASTLLESELFGHAKGSFTGALSDRKGLIEAASGGWLFLDEVGTLSPTAQIALLRVLENGEVMRVGTNIPLQVDVKFLSATNQDIEAMIVDGRFRKDLWQRLNEVTIVLPPLVDRKDEISLLAYYFCSTMKGGPYEITKAALDVLCEYDWREGNVRELRNCLRAMTELSSNGKLTPISIPERILKKIDDCENDGVLESSKQGAEKFDGSGATGELGTKAISMQIDFAKPVIFDDLSNILLGEVLAGMFAYHGAISLRKLSTMVGISRSTLSARIKDLVECRQISPENLKLIIKLTDG
jgi:DNA-binding NtrC family response regulator